MTGFKTIRIIGFFATGMGLVVASAATAQALARMQAASTPLDRALVPASLAFLAIGWLAFAAGSMLSAQAEQISDLQRQLANARRTQ